MADEIVARLGAERSARERIRPVERGGVLSLSFAQERLRFLDQTAAGLALYNVPVALRLRGRLEVGVLRRALSRVVARHEALRTRFGSVRGVPYQLIDPPGPVELPVQPVTGAALEQRVVALGRQPFDLERGPLLRAHLLRLGELDHLLVLNAHHIVTDGWSVRVLLGELAAVYEALLRGRPDPLPPLAIQYADYAVWQRQWLQGGVLEEQLAYWTRQLAGLSSLEFPADRPRPAAPSYAGGLVERVLPAGLQARLVELARASQVTLFTVLLAAFQVLLGRYCQQDDVVVGSVFAGRTRSELEPLVGFFANTLVLRSSLAGDPPFGEVLRRVNEVVLEAHSHQEVPFGKLVEVLRPVRDPGRNPLFQTSFTLQATLPKELRLGDLAVEEISVHSGASRFDIGFNAGERQRGFMLWAEYSTELFERERIERLFAHYQVLLEGIVANPQARVSQLGLLPSQERAQLHAWNQTQQAYPSSGRLLHQLVAEQAHAHPDRVAVCFQDRQVRYGELDQQANWLAWQLRQPHLRRQRLRDLRRPGQRRDPGPGPPRGAAGPRRAGPAADRPAGQRHRHGPSRHDPAGRRRLPPPAGRLRGRRGLPRRAGQRLEPPRPAVPQRLRPHRDHRHRNRLPVPQDPPHQQPTHRPGHGQPPRLGAGPPRQPGPHRRPRRAARGRRRRRPRLPGPPPADRRTVPARALRPHPRPAHVPHRRPGPVAPRRPAPVPGPPGPPGQDPRGPHR